MDNIQSFEEKELKISYTSIIVGILLLAVLLTLLIRSGFPKGFIFLGFVMLGMIITFTKIEYGILSLFIYITFISYFRRLFYTSTASVKDFDILVVLPEFIIVFLVMKMFFDIITMNKEPFWVEEGKRNFDVADLWITIFLIYQMMEIFNSSLLSPISGILGFRAFGIYMFLYYIARQYIDTKKKMDILINIIIISCFFAGLYGIKQMLFGFNSGEKILIESGQFQSLTIAYTIRRVFSTLNSPIHAGIIFILGSVFSLNRFQKSETLKEKVIYSLIIITLMFANIGTIQRTNWVGMIAVFVFYFVLQPGIFKKLNIKLFASLGILIILSLFIVSKVSIKKGPVEYRPYDIFIEKFETIKEPEKVGSFQLRLKVWSNLKKILFTKPFGYGLYSSKFEEEESFGTDNIYFTFILQNGAVGLFLYLFGVIFILLRVVKIFREVKDEYFIENIVIFASVIISVLIMGITANLISVQPLIFFIFIWLGIIVNYKKITTEVEETPSLNPGVYFSRYR
ncbi:MAG: O-antigen ligase family protein [bacterium]|nr:O-antigen ligase family protein [bacterium]